MKISLFFVDYCIRPRTVRLAVSQQLSGNWFMRQSLLLLATGIVSAAACLPARAQSDASATGMDQALDDVIVTATRYQSTVQKTPISLQVYSGAELANRGVTDVTSLAQTDSSVNINYSTGMPIIAIRGVSSQNATEVGDPAVSVATDGVFNNRPYGVFGALYDISRVEILRGPQGTLFGRNSTGGTLNIITARPTATNEAQITGEVGNFSLFGAQGFANFVVTDWLDARVSFDARTRNGFRDNTPALDRGDDEDSKSGRFQLGFRPWENLEGWLLGQYTQQGGTGPVSEIIPFSYLNGVGGEPVHNFPAGMSSDGTTFPLYARNIRNLQHTEARTGWTYTLPSAISISYLGGYDYIRYLRQQSLNPYFGGAGNGPVPVPLAYNNIERPQTFNHELRIASAPDARFTWQTGAYYFQERSRVFAYTQFNPDSNIAAKGVEFAYPKINSTSKALYAQGGFAITDQLKVNVGGRYTWDSKLRTGTFLIDPAQTGLPFVITVDQPASARFSKATWMGDVDYQVTPDNLLYAKVSTGYKAGGFNDATSTYGPETVRSYEVGSKNTLLAGHVQLNATGFRMDYDNQQVTQFVAGVTSSGSETVNAGASRIWGAEFNVVAQEDRAGRLNLSANYTHARYLQFLSSAGWDGTINLDLAGKTLPLAPTWSAAAQYERPVNLPSGATLTPRVLAKVQSLQYFASNNYRDQSQGAYALVDLGLDFAPGKKNWLLQLYVKNLADRKVFSDATEFYLFNNYQYSYQPPRTYGARVTVNLP